MTGIAVQDEPDLKQQNKTPNDIKIEIPSRSEFVSVVRLAVAGIAARMEFSVNDIEDIKVAVSEACTNCVQHAYDEENGRIFVTCYLSKNELEIVIEDMGKGFDIKKLGSEEQIKNSQEKLGLGLGLTFIKTLMDRHSIESMIGGGTCIKMTKIRLS